MASTPRIPNAEITGLYGALSDSAESCSMTSPSRRAKASEVSRWRESTVFTSLERDVMEYAEAMSETPPRVIEELFSRLLRQLGASAMVELTSWVAFANVTTRSNIARIESQAFSKAWKLPLAQPSAAYATSA